MERKIEDHAERIVRIETQIGRLVSDAESEKDTRLRVNQGISDRFDKIEVRLTKIERAFYIGTGGLAALMFILNAILMFILKMT